MTRARSGFVAVVNPAAGGGRCARRVGPVLARLRDAGLTIEVRETQAPGHGIAITREAVEGGCRDVIAVGGDGTANEVVNGITEAAVTDREERVRLGLLPLGTGNSFLRDFSTHGAEHAIQALTSGQRRPCDILRLVHDTGSRDFINVLGFGFPADVGELVDRRLKPLGAPGYTVGVLAKLAGLRALDLSHRLDDGAPFNDAVTLLCVCNSRFTGGTMEMAPPARIDDGLMDVVRVDRASRLTLLRTFPKIFRGAHLAHPAVHHAHARRLIFDTKSPVAINLDGEVMRVVPQSVEVLSRAIDLAV